MTRPSRPISCSYLNQIPSQRARRTPVPALTRQPAPSLLASSIRPSPTASPLACYHGDGRDDLGEGGEALGHGAVVNPGGLLAAADQSGIVKDLEVVTHCGLREAEWFGQLTDAGLTVLVGLNQRQQPKPGGVGQRFEAGSELGRVGRRDRLPGER